MDSLKADKSQTLGVSDDDDELSDVTNLQVLYWTQSLDDLARLKHTVCTISDGDEVAVAALEVEAVGAPVDDTDVR